MLCVGCWDKSRMCWVVCSIIASSSVCICTLIIWKIVYIHIRGQPISLGIHFAFSVSQNLRLQDTLKSKILD
jgi:hypothetical protein